ncbi:DUF6392 family protein [Chimaeribacter arupi]|uniref:DUF6392 family protein n=1 Tax=Chimaeribacter arupi TaxID=2060066 RepID=UPI003CE5C10E
MPPRKHLREDVGYTDLFTVVDFHTLINMQFDYDVHERVKVKEVAFILTSEICWYPPLKAVFL